MALLYNKRMQLSMVIPVHNEEECLEDSLKAICSGLEARLGLDNFEIVLVENGSTDGTRAVITKKIAQGTYSNNIKAEFIDQKGIGLAYKGGIELAKYPHVLLSAVDLPFGFSDVDQLLTLSLLPDIAFFSKTHPKSVVPRSFNRKLASFILNSLFKLFYKVRVGDTQGTIFLNKKSIKRLVNYCVDSGPFFTAQLAIYSTKSKVDLVELPVTTTEAVTVRKSRFNILSDGWKTLIKLLRERERFMSYEA